MSEITHRSLEGYQSSLKHTRMSSFALSDWQQLPFILRQWTNWKTILVPVLSPHYCTQTCSQLCQTMLPLHLSYFPWDEGKKKWIVWRVIFSEDFFLSFKEVLSPSCQTFELSVSFIAWQKHKPPLIIRKLADLIRPPSKFYFHCGILVFLYLRKHLEIQN